MDSSMDPASLQLIQEMMQEESVYFDDSTDAVPTRKKKSKCLDGRLMVDASVPVVRWTDQETGVLLDALNTYGRNYKLISELLGTRTPRQVKSRVSYLVQHGQLPTSESKPTLHHYLESDVGGVVIHHEENEERIKKEEEEEEQVDIMEDSGSSEGRQKEEDVPVSPDSILIEDDLDSSVVKVPPIQIVDSVVTSNEVSVKETPLVIPSVVVPPCPPSPIASSESETDDPVMTNHPDIDIHTIQDFEIFANPEYFPDESYRTKLIFTGRSANKTPQRYKFIRDFILQLWDKRKPHYVTKTMARKGLIGHGDVHAISRVHAFLERVGAINVGAVTIPGRRAPRPFNKKQSKDPGYSPSTLVSSDVSLAYIMMDTRRHRRIRNEQGEWMDEREAEGHAIDHDTQSQPVVKRKKLTSKWMEYDPFKLIPMNTSPLVPPFTLSVQHSAMLVMDFHAHLASTEIIGLLGGSYHEEETRLVIECAFPCHSTSTEVQCEMDPASEMQARQVFADKGWAVVGWYHSHPTFEPHPSIRDIENQGAYQSLFRREKDGIEPFVGVIVQPYPSSSDHLPMTRSNISFVSISHEYSTNKEYRIPYACQPTLITETTLSPDVLTQLTQLVDMYQHHPHKLLLQDPISTGRAVPQGGPEPTTRLDKLLQSIQSHLSHLSDTLQKDELGKIRQILHSQQ